VSTKAQSSKAWSLNLAGRLAHHAPQLPCAAEVPLRVPDDARDRCGLAGVGDRVRDGAAHAVHQNGRLGQLGRPADPGDADASPWPVRAVPRPGARSGPHLQEGVIDTDLVRPMPVYRHLQLSFFPTNTIGGLTVAAVPDSGRAGPQRPGLDGTPDHVPDRLRPRRHAPQSGPVHGRGLRLAPLPCHRILWPLAGGAAGHLRQLPAECAAEGGGRL
jgi:hypothetical protein